MPKKLICTLKLLTCIIYVQVLLSGAFQFSSLIEECYFMTFNNMVVSSLHDAKMVTCVIMVKVIFHG